MYHPNEIPTLSIIVALAANNAIGKDNRLLWHLSDDLKRFKALTTGHAVIMGRKTFDSLPRGPLPNRRNIVLTHNADFHPEGVEVVHSVGAAFDRVRTDTETFIMGGAAIYELFLPFVQRLYVTRIHHDFEGDVFFPTIDLSVFHPVSESELMVDSKSDLSYSYITYERRCRT